MRTNEEYRQLERKVAAEIMKMIAEMEPVQYGGKHDYNMAGRSDCIDAIQAKYLTIKDVRQQAQESSNQNAG